MKFARLILSNFKRHKTRTVLTLLSIMVAFVLFAYLAAIKRAFSMAITAWAAKLSSREISASVNGFTSVRSALIPPT
jgi:hypothetical protein